MCALDCEYGNNYAEHVKINQQKLTLVLLMIFIFFVYYCQI